MGVRLTASILSCLAAVGVGLDGTNARAHDVTIAPSKKPPGEAASHRRHHPRRGTLKRSQSPRSVTGSRATATASAQQGSGVTQQITILAGIPAANGVTNTTPGGGLMPVQSVARSQSGETRDFIAKQAPTATTAELLGPLPGVVGGSTNPFGATEPDTFTVRGLTVSELGFEMEGIPIQDPVNGNVFTTDIIDSENIKSLTLTQGSSDISAPFYSAVGGQVRIDTINPSARHGGFVDLGFGTDAAQREFLRLDTGDIGNSGVKAFASYSHTQADLIRGPGDLYRDHVDAKAIKDWDDGNTIAVTFDWDQQFNTALRYPTLAQYQQYGTSLNYNTSYTPGDVDYYKFQYQNRTDLLGSIPVHLDLAPHLTLDITPYYVSDVGIYGGADNLPEVGSYQGTAPLGNLNQPFATNGIVTAEEDDHESESSTGVTTNLALTAGHNVLRTGYWYAYLEHTELESLDGANYSGQVANLFGQYPIKVNGQVLTGYNINFKQQTNAIFVDDAYTTLGGKLILEAGFREVMLQRIATDIIPGEPYPDGANYAEPLPRLSASLKLTPSDQLFADVSTGFQAPSSEEVYVDLFDPANSGVPIESRATSLKPEYAIGEELGYRSSGWVNATTTFFNYNLTNHQVTSSNFVGSTLVTEPLNVGGETARGFQIELGIRPRHFFSPFVSFQYLHTSIGNNLRVGNDYLPTEGKSEVESPTASGSVGINYDNGRLFGFVDTTWATKQYATFTNDQALPGYAVANLTLGYRLHRLGPARFPQIQLNVTNFTNNHYLSGIFGFTPTAQTTRGIHGTTIAGSSPTYYIGAGPAAIVSLSGAF